MIYMYDIYVRYICMIYRYIYHSHPQQSVEEAGGDVLRAAAAAAGPAVGGTSASVGLIDVIV
jgi:hypothetical protein